MGSIQERIEVDGVTKSYRVKIRKNGFEDINKTFKDKHDAELYVWYKERLLNNIENFDVSIEKRTTLLSILELKMSTLEESDKKALLDYISTKERLFLFFKHKCFYNDISFENWLEFCKFMLNHDVYRGAKTDGGKRKMSPVTLRKIMAMISSAVSHAQGLGIPLDNNPLKVIQTYINPLIKNKESK